MKGAYWEGKLEELSTTGAWIWFGGYLLETYSSIQQIVALSTTENEYISTKDVTNALEIRSDLAECDSTLRTKGKTDVTPGRAMAARRGVGRVHHLDARFSWLQRLWAEGVVHWCLRSSQPGEHNEADLESNEDLFDFTFQRNTTSTTNEFIELELTDGGSKFPRG